MKKLTLLLLLISPLFIFGQSIELFEQFNGRYGFTAIGNTLNEEENMGISGYCNMLSESSAALNLESNQTIHSAHLYWGSIGQGDFEVNINGADISADRTFSLIRNGKSYFSAYADVTDLITSNGNGIYTFSGLNVLDIIDQYCGYNFGGWAIYIIYEDPTELLNQISIYDGMKDVGNFNYPINITLTNIAVTSDQFSKIGFLAWEGDRQIGDRERLYINGEVISNPPLNPEDNAFNGTNSYIGPPENAQNYNMDLDYYDLVGLIQPGDRTIDIKLTSGTDWILMNNIITKVNSELPDATIIIDNVNPICHDGTIEVDYTVSNFNSTAALPPNVPIAFYANNVHLGQASTVNAIPRHGSESGSVNLDLPPGTPQTFTLKAVVDDDGTGNGIIDETNEDNNEFEHEVVLESDGLLILGNNHSCEGQTETLTANFTNLDVYNWFLNGIPFGENTPTIDVTQSGNYTVSGSVGNCFISESPVFAVTFNTTPVANPAEDLFKCDNGTQTDIFNLTQNDDDVLGGQDPALFEVKYFTTEADSENNINAITTPEAYPIAGPSPQTIYVRIHDRTQESCYNLTQFEIFYTPLHAGDVPSVSLCDPNGSGTVDINLRLEFDDLVLNGQNASDYNITYHSSQNDANSGNDPLPDVISIPVPGQTIFIRIEPVIDSNCFDTTSVEILVEATLSINETPDPLVMCDDDNDGFVSFTLHNADDDITGGDPTLTVSYHYTLQDAENNDNILPEPFPNNIAYNDEVFARVENAYATCYATALLKLEVRDSPVLTEPTPYNLCDDDTDGYAVFNLSTKEDEIRNGLDPLLYDLYYYSSEQDAMDAGIAALDNPDFSEAITDITSYQNEVPNSQTIFVLGVGSDINTTPNNGAQGCYDIVEMQLIVDPKPIGVTPEDYNLCDDTLNGSTTDDQISTFDLTSRDDEITGGNPDLLVTWFETLADEAADNPISNPTQYQNTSNPQTIVARLYNGFECRDLVDLTLVVNPIPTPRNPEPLRLCDEGNGFAEFDLSLRTTEIENGESDVSVRYFPTEAEAEIGGSGEIPSPFLYTNIIPFNDSVWARVEKDVTGCFALVELELIVIPTPIVNNTPDPLTACDDDNDGLTEFFLHNADEDITDGNPTLTVTYHYTLQDAENNDDVLPEPFPNSIPYNDEVFARIEDSNTTCYTTVLLRLEVRDSPVLTEPIPYEICDDDTDGYAIFDLTTKEDEIL